jgi:hypothetical protein
MTDFEKAQIGFDVGWSVFFVTALIGMCCIQTTLDEIKWWLERDFKTKFGYTECWKI